MYGLRVGALVEARRTLDARGANVKRGTLGVVFEATIYSLDGSGCVRPDVEYGPQVRWFTGTTCNVYPGDVRHVTGSEISRRLPLVEADALMASRAPRRHGRVAVRAWLWARLHAADVAQANGVQPYYTR